MARSHTSCLGGDLVVKLNDTQILTVNENFESDENNDALMNSRSRLEVEAPRKRYVH